MSVALLPRHKIFLTSAGYVDDARFVRVFRATWRRIPLRYRCRLLAYWRELQNESEGLCPVFFPAQKMPTDHERVDAPMALGLWKSFGGSTHYLAPVVEMMPDNILSTLIAHELAHVAYRLDMQFSQPELFTDGDGALTRLCLRERDEVERYGDEMEVREMQDEWGFDEDECCEWLQASQVQLYEITAANH